MRLIAAVDGGQSKTVTVLLNDGGEILGAATTGPCNHVHEPGGLERQTAALRGGIEGAFADAGLPVQPVECAYLGLTGDGHPDALTAAYGSAQVIVAHDAYTALAGAIPSMVGVLIIAGTGSVALGRNAHGEQVIIGGHGYYIGDEGSGADIARRGFQAVFQASDGRMPDTRLTQLILAYYDCAHLKALRHKVYAELTRDQLAGAARMVGQAAADGDIVAIQILHDAGVELGRTVAAALIRLGMTAVPALVAPAGSVFNSGALVTQPMMAHVQQINPQAALVEPRFPPVIGAALLGLQTIGVNVDEAILRNIERTNYSMLNRREMRS